MDLLFENLEALIDASNGIEKTRELVLQLAVQGKLTEQDPNDEPASALLKKVKKEKEKLITEGKIKKQKELPSIKDEKKPFELPKGWEWERFQNITSIITCGMASTPTYTETGRMFLSAKNVKPYRFLPYDYKFVSEETYLKIIQNAKPELNDILLTRVGAGIGEACLIDQEIDFAYYVSLTLIKPFQSFILSEYLLNYLSSPLGITNAISKTYGMGVSQGNLNVNQVRKYIIPIPPLNEQKRIVEKVKSLMALLDEIEKKRERRNQKRIKLNNASLEKLLTSKDDKELKSNWNRIEENFCKLYSVPENVEKLKQAILQLAVQGKLVKQDPSDEPASELLKKIKKEREKFIAEGKIKRQKELPPIKDEEISFELPKGWIFEKIGNISQHNSGKTLDSGRNTGKARDCLTTSNLYWGFFNLNSVKQILIEDRELEKCTALKGDLLICEGGEAGRAAIWEYNWEVCFQNHIHRVRPYGKINTQYLYWYFYLLHLSGEINKYRKGVGISNLSGKSLSSIVIPLPPLDEQKRIVEKVNELMSLCNTLKERLNKKEDEGEKLINAIVNSVSNNIDKKKELIRELMTKHEKALDTLS